MPKNPFVQIATKDLKTFFSLPDGAISKVTWEKVRKQKGTEFISTTNGFISIDVKIPNQDHEALRVDRPNGFCKNYPPRDSARFEKINRINEFERQVIYEYGWALDAVSKLGDSELVKGIQSNVLELAIASAIAYYWNNKDSKSVHRKDVGSVKRLLQVLKGLASKTYEGSRVQVNLLLLGHRKSPELGVMPVEEYFDQKWSPALGTSDESAVEVAEVSVGGISQLIVSGVRTSWPRKSPTTGWVPQSLGRLSTVCSQGTIGFSLFPSGDLAVILDGNLMCAYRQGSWKGFCLDDLFAMGWVAPSGGFESTIAAPDQSPYRAKTKPELKETVIDTLLDASFHRHGASLALVANGAEEDLRCLVKQDQERVGTGKRTQFWKQGILAEADFVPDYRQQLYSPDGGPILFGNLTRSQRLELLNMDGATIVDSRGHILGIGVIAPVKNADGGGGRTAAVHSLGRYGTAFKVSQDGPVTMFSRFGTKNARIDQIESINVLEFG